MVYEDPAAQILSGLVFQISGGNGVPHFDPVHISTHGLGRAVIGVSGNKSDDGYQLLCTFCSGYDDNLSPDVFR